MRILLSTIGTRGDVQPLVALALQLRPLGQDVRFCVPPDFREWVEGLGFEMTPIGPDLRQAMASAPPRMAGPPIAEQKRQAGAAFAATQFETITEAARGCDLIVAATALQIAARSIAETMRVPYVFAAYCPIVFPSPHHAPPPQVRGTPPPDNADNRQLWTDNAHSFNTTFGTALNEHRASAGLRSIDDVRSYMFTERPWLAADPALAPWPDPDGAVFQTGAWMMEDDRPLAPELETFLAHGEPPIYFGFGSMRAPPEVARAMIQAARALGRRAIVYTGWADLSVADHEPECLVLGGDVNQQALFPRLAAVVHTAAPARPLRRHAPARRKSSSRRRTTSTTGLGAWPSWGLGPHTRLGCRAQSR